MGVVGSAWGWIGIGGGVAGGAVMVAAVVGIGRVVGIGVTCIDMPGAVV